MRRFIIGALAACTVLLLAAPAPAQAHRDASISYIDEWLEVTPLVSGGRWGGECGKGANLRCYRRSSMDPVAYKRDFDHDGDYTSGNHSYQFKGAFWEKKGDADCRRVTIRANVEGHKFELGTHDGDNFPRVWHDGAYSRDNGNWIEDDPDRCPGLGGGSSLASLQDDEEDTPGTATDACYVNPGRYYTATCPGDNGDSYTPPAGWDVTEAIAEPPEQHKLLPVSDVSAVNFITSPTSTTYFDKVDEGFGPHSTFLDSEYIKSQTPSRMHEVSYYTARLSDLPAGSTGTWDVVLNMHVTADGNASPFLQIRHVSGSYAQKTVPAGFSGWTDLEATGLTAAQVNDLRLSIQQAWTASGYARVDSVFITATATS